MGCGSSAMSQGATNLQDKIIKPIDKTAILYFKQGSGKIIDMTGKFLENPFDITDKKNESWGFDMEEFGKKFAEAEKIVFIIPVDGNEAWQFFAIQFDKCQFDIKKCHFMYITSTAGTPAEFQGSMQEGVKLWLCMKEDVKTTFIERSAWYGTGPQRQDFVPMLIENDEQVAYFPDGEKTREDLKIFNERTDFQYSKRMYTHWLVGEGAEEGQMGSGDKVIRKILGSDSKPVAFKLSQPPQIQVAAKDAQFNWPNTEKYVVPLGKKAQELCQGQKNVVSYESLMKKYGDHREYLLVLDYSDKINKDFVKCEFNEHNFTTFACIHLIQDNDEVDQCSAAYPFHAAIENCTLNIPMKVYHPQAKKFIAAMMQTPCTWSEMAEQLVPFPRMSWMTPYFKEENLLHNDAKIEDKSTLCSYSFEDSSWQKLEDKSLIIQHHDNFKMQNRFVNINNAGAAKGLALAANFTQMMKFLKNLYFRKYEVMSDEEKEGKEQEIQDFNKSFREKYIRDLYDIPEEECEMCREEFLSNIGDLYSEYEQYAQCEAPGNEDSEAE